MRFLLDENFPKAATILLRDLGHETFDFRGTPEEGLEDSMVFQKAQDLDAILLTTDRDFFHTIPHLFDKHAGVVVIALRQPSRAAILDRLSWLLSHLPGKAYPNRVFQLRDASWLSYPPVD